MAETSPDFGDEHIVIHIDAKGPIDLEELHASLAALARIYKRQYPAATEAPPAKLFVTKVTSGSIDLEIVPLLALLGMPIPYMDGALIVRDFVSWIARHLRSAADASLPSVPDISKDEAKDLNAFVAPMTGRKGANLGLTHARFHRREKSGNVEREIVAEYNFNETEINRAALNLNRIEGGPRDSQTRYKTEREVLMAFQQADKSPGKERGRTGDRVIISAISDKALPVYFPKEASNIKRLILEQTENPFTKGYVVDVHVQFTGDDIPKMYSVIALHEIVDID